MTCRDTDEGMGPDWSFPPGPPQDMPHQVFFPHALGTGIVVNTSRPLPSVTREALDELINSYEAALSRFRPDSLLTLMSRSAEGGSYVFPDYCNDLFDLYDRLYMATGGALDPAVGADLVGLGYGSDMTFTMQPGIAGRLGRIRGRATWGEDVRRVGARLVTTRPVQLDFGAAGKGYLVDMMADVLEDASLNVGEAMKYVVDAGGDMRFRSVDSLSVAMEDPDDLTRGVGLINMRVGSLCASAPSRRHWDGQGDDVSAGSLIHLHHILNAIDGYPVRQINATWVCVDSDSHPTAVADGLSTGLFLVEPDVLARYFSFTCAVMNRNRQAVISQGFPGHFFVLPAESETVGTHGGVSE